MPTPRTKQEVVNTKPKEERKKTSPPPKNVGSKKDTSKDGGKDKGKTKKKSELQKSIDAGKAAENRAIKRDNKLRLEAGMRFNQSAVDLGKQIKAIKDALNTEFARSRDQNLGDIDMMLQQQFGILKEDASKRGNQFLISALDNEKATGDTQESGFRNVVRERAESMSAILEQGAGETDAMRAMVASARNWHGNAGEANRSYFDTAASINAGINDLNVDARTALTNAHMTAEGQKETLWQDFYNRRSEAFTQLGNAYGQQASFMDQAKEMGVKFGTVRNKRTADARSGMEQAFKDAANESGKSYKQAALPEWARDYQGMEQVDRRQSNSELAAAVQFEPLGKAEGATLRKWEAA